MNPLKEYAKGYFKHFIKSLPPNVKAGDTLRIGAIFYNEKGEPSEIKNIVTVHKDEL